MHWITSAQLAQLTFPAPLVDDALQANEFTYIGGRHAELVATALAWHLEHGRPFLGQPVRQCRVENMLDRLRPIPPCDVVLLRALCISRAADILNDCRERGITPVFAGPRTDVDDLPWYAKQWWFVGDKAIAYGSNAGRSGKLRHKPGRYF